MAITFGRVRTLLPRRCRFHDQSANPDPIADHLITPENAMFLLIDYQPW
jgi:hypothetical protein